MRALLQADGMAKWRADTSKLPPRRPANASMEQLLEHVPRGASAWLAFGNAGVTEMLLNWAHHVIAQGHGWHMVVAAFDLPLLTTLHLHGIPACARHARPRATHTYTHTRTHARTHTQQEPAPRGAPGPRTRLLSPRRAQTITRARCRRRTFGTHRTSSTAWASSRRS